MTVLDLELLEAFLAVADQRSFTRAAAQLKRTQSSVSLQVRKLEERLATPLFHRTTARVDLSPAGEALIAYARRMLELNDEAIGRLRQRRLEGVVRLGVMEDYGTLFLPALLSRFAAAHPRVRIEMEAGLTATMVERVGTDFDVVVALHPEGSGAAGVLLRREQAVWAAGPHFRPGVSDPLPLALYPPGCLLREWAVQALDAAGRSWQLAFVCQGLAAVAAVAAEGLAVTVVKAGTLPRSLVPLGAEDGLPQLPAGEIRLHVPAAAAPAARRLAHHLRAGLSDPVPLPRRDPF